MYIPSRPWSLAAWPSVFVAFALGVALGGCTPEPGTAERAIAKDLPACHPFDEIQSYGRLLNAEGLDEFLANHERHANKRGLEPITREHIKNHASGVKLDTWCLRAPNAGSNTSRSLEHCHALAIVAQPWSTHYLHAINYLMSASRSSGRTLLTCMFERYPNFSTQTSPYCGFSVMTASQATNFWDKELTKLRAADQGNRWLWHRAQSKEARSGLAITSLSLLRSTDSCCRSKHTEPAKNEYRRIAQSALGDHRWTSPL